MDPVQILSIENNSIANPDRVKLNRIFRDYSNKKVGIISVIGPCQTGRSFFLNYLQRALSAASDGNEDLLGQESPNEELTGFKWGAHEERMTSGVWISAEPAILKTCRGEQVAVFLLDFQSIFDEFSSPEENLILLGLCQQISNYTILNVKYELSEEKIGLLGENLKSLSKFFPGLKFNKFSLLLRDYGNLNEVSFESKYFEERLEISRNHSKGSKENRQILKSAIDDDKTCFILPKPVENPRSEDFKGIFCQLDPNFFRNLEGILLNLVNLDNISSSGRFSKGHEIVKLFGNFCKIINKEENSDPVETLEQSFDKSLNFSPNRQNLPKTGEIFQTSNEPMDIDTLCKMLIQNSVQNIQIAVQQNAYGFIPEIQLADMILAEISEAQNTIGNADLKHPYKIINDKIKQLVKSLKAEFDTIKRSNYNKIESIKREFEKKISEIENFFKSQLDELNKKESSVILIKQKLKNILIENLAEFENWAEKAEPGMKSEFCHKLSESLDQYAKQSITNFESNLKDQENATWDLDKELKLKNYDEQFHKLIIGCDKPYEYYHKLVTVAILISINNSEHKSELKALLQEKFDTFLKKQEDQVLEETCKVSQMQILADGKRRYLKEINDFINQHQKSSDFLTKLKVNHKIIKDQELMSCKSILKSSKINENELNEILQELTEEIDFEFKSIEKVQLEKQDKKNQIVSNLNINFEQGVAKYDEMMKGWKDLKSDEELKDRHKEALNVAIDYFQSMEVPHELAESQITKMGELKKLLQDRFRNQMAPDLLNISRNNTQSIEIAQRKTAQNFQGAKIEGKIMYKEEMDNHFKNNPHTPFIINIHKSICSKIFMKYEISDDSKVKELQELLDACFEVYLDRNNMSAPVGELAIGIDLGTTYSCVSIYRNGKVEIIPNEFSNKTVPSFVCFTDTDSIVGELAKQQAHESPEKTIFDVKRLIGRKFADDVVKEDMKLWPFRVVGDDNGNPSIEANGNRYVPEQISAKVLKYLKQMAEKHLDCSVNKAVITVPAYFNNGQKQATIDAGIIAGLEVLEIITEPTAAALAFHDQGISGKPRNVLVYDLGGGTFDVSVLKMDQRNITVLALDGDTHLGGEDFDNKMVDWCIKKFLEKENFDLTQGRNSSSVVERGQAARRLRRLRNECERRKKDLSVAPRATIKLDAIYNKKEFNELMTKKEFEDMNMGYFNRTLSIVQKALTAAKLSKSEIDDVVLVGGSTRISKIREMLSEFFNGKILDNKVNPDEAVAYGAALRAALINGEQNMRAQNFTDVTPLSLGIRLRGGEFSVIIPKNTPYPMSKTDDSYTTSVDNQTKVGIEIFEGEDKKADNNHKLGRFDLGGIPPKRKGVEKLSVTMNIDKGGILHVSAAAASGSTNNVTITENRGRLSSDEIKRYLRVG